MKIRSATAFLQEIPLTKPYTIAYNTTTNAEIVFLEMELENGMVGLGASSACADVVGETPAQTLYNLQQPFVQELTGKDIRNFYSIINEVQKKFPNQPGTLAAIDLALHDAFGQYLGIPVADFYGRKTGPLPTSITIGIKETAEMLEEAKSYYAAGFRVIKLKTGAQVEEDIERVTRLYEQFGNNIKIRVDANTGYQLAQLQYFLEQTKTISIELIEQPLPVGHEQELTTLSAKQRELLAADESLLDAVSALQLAQKPVPYGIFNIKLMKCGGINAAREIGLIAEKAGIHLFWGCNDESMAGIAAALHAAYSCPNTRYLDLDGSFDLTTDLVTSGFILKDGLMYCSEGPGLGLNYHRK